MEQIPRVPLERHAGHAGPSWDVPTCQQCHQCPPRQHQSTAQPAHPARAPLRDGPSSGKAGMAPSFTRWSPCVALRWACSCARAAAWVRRSARVLVTATRHPTPHSCGARTASRRGTVTCSALAVTHDQGGHRSNALPGASRPGGVWGGEGEGRAAPKAARGVADAQRLHEWEYRGPLIGTDVTASEGGHLLARGGRDVGAVDCGRGAASDRGGQDNGREAVLVVVLVQGWEADGSAAEGGAQVPRWSSLPSVGPTVPPVATGMWC